MLIQILCMLLAGCQNPFANNQKNNHDQDAPERYTGNPSYIPAKLYVKEVNWHIQQKPVTETENFATKLWLDKVRSRITTTGVGQILNIRVKSSSFIEMKDTIEFKVKLLCRAGNSDIELKINLKGKKTITSIGATLDQIADDIADNIIERLFGDYGNPPLVHQKPIPKKAVHKMEDAVNLIKPDKPLEEVKPVKGMNVSKQPVQENTQNLVNPPQPEQTKVPEVQKKTEPEPQKQQESSSVNSARSVNLLAVQNNISEPVQSPSGIVGKKSNNQESDENLLEESAKQVGSVTQLLTTAKKDIDTLTRDFTQDTNYSNTSSEIIDSGHSGDNYKQLATL